MKHSASSLRPRDFIQVSRREREVLVIVFLDLVKNFDLVDREDMMRFQETIKVAPTISLIWQMLENSYVEVDSDNNLNLKEGLDKDV